MTMLNVSSSNNLSKYPKLRFPGFNKPISWLPLSEYLIENTTRNKKLMFSKEDVLSVSGSHGVVNQIAFQGKSFAGDQLAEYHVVETKDVVYTKSPLKANPYGIIKTNKGIPGIVSPLYAVYHPLDNVIPDFVEYYFANNFRLNKFLKPLVNIGAKHDMQIKNEFFLTGIVGFPSKSEQEKIVSFLNALDAKITIQQELVDDFKKYKRGVLDRLLRNKLSVWKKVKLGDVVSIMRGGSPRPIEAYITNDPSGLNWIKIGDVPPDSLYITKAKEKIKPSGVKKSRQVFKGDLILSNSMSFGRPYILQIDGCIHDGWLLIRDTKNLFDKRFLCYYLSSNAVLAQYKRFAAGSCVNNLNSELVGKVEISMPPLAEQVKISTLLDLLDAKAENAIKQYNSLILLKNALLQQLFI